MSNLCPVCKSVMKPLWYLHSLFCPNDCDRKDAFTAWRRCPNGISDYYYRILNPQEPFPEDAEFGWWLVRESKEKAEERVNDYLKDWAEEERVPAWDISDFQREERKKGGENNNDYVLVFKLDNRPD